MPATQPEYTPITITITAPINKGPPFFMSSLKSQQVQAGKTLAFIFPSISDPDSNDVGSCTNIDFGLAGNFTTGRYPTL